VRHPPNFWVELPIAPTLEGSTYISHLCSVNVLRREFEVYMAEVRGVPGVMSEGKREVTFHFFFILNVLIELIEVTTAYVLYSGHATFQDLYGGL
jgi:hypothetical protein